MPMFDMTEKVAVITGSSRGIGRAIAEQFAVQGAKVVISSRTIEACGDVAEAINAEHGDGTAVAIAASLSSKDALEALVAETRATFGRIDVLVCNAASNPYYGSMNGISDEQFRKILDNNVLSNHWLIQMVLPEMVERRDGAIILISSIGGLRGSPVIGTYNVSKAADLQMVRNYAVEIGRHNVRINAIAPGLIRTDFARALWEDPKAAAHIEETTPLRRLGEPNDIAGAAVFLASAAGAFTTGQTIVVDGGVTI
jgi:NAD(P)-dependent dehydrogenase (short-subunit alcohol dehydrogenase family)